MVKQKAAELETEDTFAVAIPRLLHLQNQDKNLTAYFSSPLPKPKAYLKPFLLDRRSRLYLNDVNCKHSLKNFAKSWQQRPLWF